MSAQARRHLARLLFPVAVVFGLLAGPSSPAMAACGVTPPLPEAIARAESVFVGEVQATASQGRQATMSVVEVWKGRDLPAVIEVDGTGGSNPEVGRTFQVGRTYLVVSDDRIPPFSASRCSATTLFRPTGSVPPELQDAVGDLEIRHPNVSAPTQATSGGPISLGWLVVGGVLAAGVFVLIATKFAARLNDTSRRAAAEGRHSVLHRLSLAGFLGKSGMTRLGRLRSGKR